MESLLCVHAHPDDEALWTGGLLAKHADAGARTAVLTCTWAEGTPRAGELARSLEILGAEGPRLLGYADAGAGASAPEGVPRFVDVPLDEAVGQVVARIREFRPEVVVTYDAFGGYGHEDHIHAHRVATLAAEAAGQPQLYPEAGAPWRPEALCYATLPVSFVREVWHDLFGEAPPPAGGAGSGDGAPLPGVPDAWITDEVGIAAWGGRKWDALMAHTTEVERGGSVTLLASLPETTRGRLLTTEWYVNRPLAPGAPRLAR
ncbi:PIG-L family deacetylase [Streptomyces iconiensis]|uniref:PIG-L family deacetylase n=1 Tax=Streptomyces iconiensis TaxID=1384038 RepID=A0ABT6ZUY1_9ACTN|nr:PIG-L family deacetylase [Streptomyces iconiensis]MDJ1132858.1 PIG-L family deacetylase [Streptomyces iconiensis]